MHTKSKEHTSQSHSLFGSSPGLSSLYGHHSYSNFKSPDSTSYKSPYSSSYGSLDYTRNEVMGFDNHYNLGTSNPSVSTMSFTSVDSSYTGGMTSSSFYCPSESKDVTVGLGIKVKIIILFDKL